MIKRLLGLNLNFWAGFPIVEGGGGGGGGGKEGMALPSSGFRT